MLRAFKAHLPSPLSVCITIGKAPWNVERPAATNEWLLDFALDDQYIRQFTAMMGFCLSDQGNGTDQYKRPQL